MNKFPTLYKLTKKNQVQQWQIFTEPEFYYTVEGIRGGVLTTSKPSYCESKNIGKSNETSISEQVTIEAQSKHKKKLAEGYSTEVETSGKVFFEPMLAFDYEKYKHLCFTVPTFIQPKLDGIRCYMNNKTLTSRNGKSILGCPHLQYDLSGLDGELYNHDLKADFNKIVSLVKKLKPTSEDLKESFEKIQFWVYDYPFYSNLVFSERYERLKTLDLPSHIVVTPCFRINSEEELLKYHNKFIEEGYEGSIIRLDLGNYENKRSKQLLKFKNWKDEEFEILEVFQGTGNRAGCANMLSVKLPTGVECNPTMTGSEEFMRQVWNNRNSLVGKFATIKYFGYTEAGSLRFPTVKSIRDYE